MKPTGNSEGSYSKRPASFDLDEYIAKLRKVAGVYPEALYFSIESCPEFGVIVRPYETLPTKRDESLTWVKRR